MNVFESIADSLERGRAKEVSAKVTEALDNGVSPEQILNEGLVVGMNVIGEQFKNNEVFVPEVLVAARAMNAGLKILKPYLQKEGVEPVGKAVICTVKGDMHDIGKNLVKMMLVARNIQVVDLGVDVSPRRFVEETIASKATLVILSGILSKSSEDMKNVIDEFEEKGIRNQVYIMVGGYFMDENTARNIGADCYTDTASSCADRAYAYLSKRPKKKRSLKNKADQNGG